MSLLDVSVEELEEMLRKPAEAVQAVEPVSLHLLDISVELLEAMMRLALWEDPELSQLPAESLPQGVEPRPVFSWQVQRLADIYQPILDILLDTGAPPLHEWRFLHRGSMLFCDVRRRPESEELRDRLSIWLAEFSEGEHAVFGWRDPRLSCGPIEFSEAGYGSQSDFDSDHDDWHHGHAERTQGVWDWRRTVAWVGADGAWEAEDDTWMQNTWALAEPAPPVVPWEERPPEEVGEYPGVEVPAAPPEEGMFHFGIWWPAREPASQPLERPPSEAAVEEASEELVVFEDDNLPPPSNGCDTDPDLESICAAAEDDEADYEFWGSSVWGPAGAIDISLLESRPGTPPEPVITATPIDLSAPAIIYDADASSAEESDGDDDKDDFWA